jgi:hypothetical protein
MVTWSQDPENRLRKTQDTPPLKNSEDEGELLGSLVVQVGAGDG